MTHWILHENALQMPKPLSASVHGSYRNGRRLHGAYYEGKRVAETRGSAYERGAKTYEAADLEHFVAGSQRDPIDVSHSDGLAIMPLNHADRLADLLVNWPEQRDLFDTLRQPLVDKPVTLQTSKITFIEHLLHSGILAKHERALYKNLETLEKAGFIGYDNRMVQLTEEGLKLLGHINTEISQYHSMQAYFEQAALPKRKLQTVIEL